MNRQRKHYEQESLIESSPNNVFEYADDHLNFSSHMNKSSIMMGGASMQTQLDSQKGQKVGSHIKMKGKVFGIGLFLDEVVTKRNPPESKVWETVGSPRLLVIGSYQMGFEIKPENGKSRFKVYINYDLPQKAQILGNLFGKMYAKWCVGQMIRGAEVHFTK